MPGIKDNIKLICDVVAPVTRKTPNGMLSYSPKKDIKIIYRSKIWDSGVIIENWWFKAYKKSLLGLSANAVVIDVGAHIGTFSLLTATTLPQARIFAFEPAGSTFTVLRENIYLHGLGDRVSAFNLAVGPTSGARLSVLFDDYNAGRTRVSVSGGTTEVLSISLDDIFIKNDISECDLLKIDCEGSEWDILSHASKDTLSKIRRICLEIHPGVDVKQLTSLLNEAGFNIQTHYLIDLPVFKKLVNVPLLFAYKEPCQKS